MTLLQNIHAYSNLKINPDYSLNASRNNYESEKKLET